MVGGGGGGGGGIKLASLGPSLFLLFLLLWRFLLAAYCCQEVLKRGRALTRSPQKIKIKKRERGASARARPEKSKSKNEKGGRARAPRKTKRSVTQHFF